MYELPISGFNDNLTLRISGIGITAYNLEFRGFNISRNFHVSSGKYSFEDPQFMLYSKPHQSAWISHRFFPAILGNCGLIDISNACYTVDEKAFMLVNLFEEFARLCGYSMMIASDHRGGVLSNVLTTCGWQIHEDTRTQNNRYLGQEEHQIFLLTKVIDTEKSPENKYVNWATLLESNR